MRKPLATIRGILLTAALAMLTWAMPARGDSVRLANNITYDPVAISSVSEGIIKFRAGDNEIVKSLTEVGKVELSDSPEYNKAEESLAAKQYAQAATGFGAVAKASAGWRKSLAQYRQMTALESAGQIDQALELWLEMAEAARGSSSVLSLRPKKMPAKGDAANDRAIALLKPKFGAVSPEAFNRAVQQALADLYERQGNSVEAQTVLNQAAGASTENSQLKLVQAHVRQGQFDKAAALLESKLSTFPPADLPTALVLLGQSQLELAKAQRDAKASRELLLKSGLNLMQVVAEFGDSEDAPQALYLAGQVNERLGNASAARAAYDGAITRYGQSPWAAKSAQAVDEMKKKPSAQP